MEMWSSATSKIYSSWKWRGSAKIQKRLNRNDWTWLSPRWLLFGCNSVWWVCPQSSRYACSLFRIREPRIVMLPCAMCVWKFINITTKYQSIVCVNWFFSLGIVLVASILSKIQFTETFPCFLENLLETGNNCIKKLHALHILKAVYPAVLDCLWLDWMCGCGL